MKTKLCFSTICLSTLLLFIAPPLFANGKTSTPIGYEGPGIIGFFLINAESTSSTNELIDGTILSGAGVFNGQLNIEAIVIGDLENISVDFELSGPMERTWTERFEPYALFGDINGVFNGALLPPGNYHLKAIAIDLELGKLNELEVRFTVPDPNGILGFNMITALNERDIAAGIIRDRLYDGQRFFPNTLFPETTDYLENSKTFEALVGDEFMGSILLTIEGPPTWGNSSRLENFKPFTIFGDQVHLPGANPNDFDLRYLPNGTYHITATPYPLPNGTGAPGLSLSVSIKLINFNPIDFEFKSQISGNDNPFIQLMDGGAYFSGLRGEFDGQTAIRATIKPFNPSGSMQIMIEGPISYSRIENFPPYSLFGDLDGVFNTREFQAGTYMLSATPYSEANGKGEQGLTRNLSFTILEGNYILNGAGLVDAESKSFLDELLSADDGNTTFKSLVDNGTVALDYDCINGPCPGSVAMALSGPVSSSRIENELPFTLFGDQGGNFMGRSLTIGNYTLSITPYTQDDGMGLAGSTITADFSIVPDSNIPFVWTDTYNGPFNPFEVIEDGKTYFPTGGFNGTNSILALTQGGSVVLEINGPINHRQTENSDPYSLFGDIDLDFNTREFPDGAYTLTATTYSKANGQGVAGVSSTISFKIERHFATNLIRLIDADTGDEIEDLFDLLDGNSIDINETPTNNATIVVEYEGCETNCPGSVLLELDGPITTSRIENERPYALFGDIDGTLNGRDFPIGNYTLAVAAFYGPIGTGTVSETQIRDFQIIDSGSTLLKTALYPNPARNITHVETEEETSVIKTVIFDLSGNKVKEISNKWTSQQTIDVSELSIGIYFIQIQLGNEWVTKKLVVN